MTETEKLLKRIGETADGIDFVTYLQQLSYDNYEAFKRDDASMNEFHKGYAYAIDNLINSFAECKHKEQQQLEDKSKHEALSDWAG